MYELARLGFVLLGLQLCLQAILGMGHIAAENLGHSESSADLFAGVVLVLFPFGLTGVGPGAALVYWNRPLASWLFPERDKPDFSRVDVLVGAGLVIAAMYLVVGGVSSLVSGGTIGAMAALLSTESLSRPYMVSSAWTVGVEGGIRAASGFVLFAFSGRMARAAESRFRDEAA